MNIFIQINVVYSILCFVMSMFYFLHNGIATTVLGFNLVMHLDCLVHLVIHLLHFSLYVICVINVIYV